MVRIFRKYHLFLIVSVLLMMLLQACASRKYKMPPLATVEGVQRHFSQGRIIDTKTGKAIDFPDLIDRLKSDDVVFIGEVHNNPEHHLMQVQLLQALMAQCAPTPAVAMEFFDTTRQPVLDRFMKGDLKEKAFLKEVDWENSWRFPYRLYRPVLLLTRDKATALLGINAPNRLVRKVARKGLESLTDKERRQMAKDIDLSNTAHRKYLKSIFGQHQFKNGSPHGMGNFEYFYEAQCIWEETMAESIAKYMKAKGGKMVVLTGNGHIADKFGIPDRLLRRMDLKTATIVLYPLTERTTIRKKLADYVWLTSNSKTARTMRRPHRMPPIGTQNKGKTEK